MAGIVAVKLRREVVQIGGESVRLKRLCYSARPVN